MSAVLFVLSYFATLDDGEMDHDENKVIIVVNEKGMLTLKLKVTP